MYLEWVSLIKFDRDFASQVKESSLKTLGGVHNVSEVEVDVVVV